MTTRAASEAEPWPALPLEAWSDTCATLHLWAQIVGKVRLAQSPWVNHGWSVTLYVTARGLTTSPVPCGTRVFQIDFDFIDHRLLIQSSDGGTGTVALRPQSVASFYRHPEPPGFAESPVRPDAAFYSPDLREFILPYDAVREARSPDDTLLEFLQATYEAASNPGGWDRDALERRVDFRPE